MQGLPVPDEVQGRWPVPEGQEEVSIRDTLRYYLGPTGIPQRAEAAAGLASMFADGQDFIDYYQSGGQTMKALGRGDVWGTVEGIGNMASAGAAMMLPGVTARAINEGVDVAGELGRFARSEAGNLPLGDAVEARGAQVLDLLAAGRGSEVTDAMLDMGDPVLNARLNDYLFRNYDLPMDTASRMERADEMGFGDTVFHGTRADFPSFRYASQGSYFADDVDYSNNWVDGVSDGNVIPARIRGTAVENDLIAASPDNLEPWERRERKQFYEGLASDEYGYSGINGGENAVINPALVRSAFARFDPRLSHLRNLSAGIAGMGLLAYDPFSGEPVYAPPPRAE